MPKGTPIDIGRVGLWTAHFDLQPSSRVRELVGELEEMGWPCVWRPETTGRDPLVAAATMLEATTTLKVATGIAQIHNRHPHAMRAGQLTLHESSGGRFLLGLGVSHQPFIEGTRKLEYRTPYSFMVEYLAAMDDAPYHAVTAGTEPPTVIAALGPKMLELSATAANGAHPYFSPVEHTARARQILGSSALLAPEQMAIVDTDRERAHLLAVKHMKRYLQLPNYANNLLRTGFTEDDLAGPSPRLIDAIVVCGTIDDVVARVAAQHDAGADHVCVQVLTQDNHQPPIREWRELADAFTLRARPTPARG